VRELNRADAAIVGLLDAIKTSFEEVAALDGEDASRRVGDAQSLEIAGAAHGDQASTLDRRPEVRELTVRGGVELTGARRARRLDGPGRRGPEHRQVADRGERGDLEPAWRDMVQVCGEGVPPPRDPGMAVQVD